MPCVQLMSNVNEFDLSWLELFNQSMLIDKNVILNSVNWSLFVCSRFLCHLFEVQWGYELRTSSVFKWSKMVLSANGLWTMACLTVCYSSHGFNNRPTGQPTRQAFHNYKVWYSNGSVKQMPGIWITTLYLWSIFTCLILQNYNMCLNFCVFFKSQAREEI